VHPDTWGVASSAGLLNLLGPESEPTVARIYPWIIHIGPPPSDIPGKLSIYNKADRSNTADILHYSFLISGQSGAGTMAAYKTSNVFRV
jgi:hypothetical protein